tara:strand:- start:778 stop:1062 length:285 start_codon:yes stop_codon:yes gene_type:complete
MDKLTKIISRCKGGFYLEVNTHKDDYTSLTDRIDYLTGIVGVDLSSQMQSDMIKNDNIVEITCYADTPIGSYCVYHYSLDAAIDDMFDTLGLSI